MFEARNFGLQEAPGYIYTHTNPQISGDDHQIEVNIDVLFYGLAKLFECALLDTNDNDFYPNYLKFLIAVVYKLPKLPEIKEMGTIIKVNLINRCIGEAVMSQYFAHEFTVDSTAFAKFHSRLTTLSRPQNINEGIF